MLFCLPLLYSKCHLFPDCCTTGEGNQLDPRILGDTLTDISTTLNRNAIQSINQSFIHSFTHLLNQSINQSINSGHLGQFIH